MPNSSNPNTTAASTHISVECVDDQCVNLNIIDNQPHSAIVTQTSVIDFMCSASTKSIECQPIIDVPYVNQLNVLVAGKAIMSGPQFDARYAESFNLTVIDESIFTYDFIILHLDYVKNAVMMLSDSASITENLAINLQHAGLEIYECVCHCCVVEPLSFSSTRVCVCVCVCRESGK